MSSNGAFLRLYPLSTRTKMSHVEGERTVVREVVCYNLRGVMEICHLFPTYNKQLQVEGHCKIPPP